MRVEYKSNVVHEEVVVEGEYAVLKPDRAGKAVI